MDYIRSASGLVGVRLRQRLRYWRLYSSALGDWRRRIADSVDSRTKFDLSRSPSVRVTRGPSTSG